MVLPTEIFELFDSLLKSSTVKPAYDIPHIVMALYLIGDYTIKERGIGRYKIKKETGLGAGTVKTLVNRLKSENIIESTEMKQKGHRLTEHGQKIFQTFLQYMSIPLRIKNEHDQYVLGDYAYFSRVNGKYVAKNRAIGINQRDAAKRVGGEGATCLLYDGSSLIFPDTPTQDYRINLEDFIKNIEEPFKSDRNLPEKGDFIVIGGAKSQNIAYLATIAAALSLLF